MCPPPLPSLPVLRGSPVCVCGLSLHAGTPFHVVCAFRGLGPVAISVRAVCPLRGGALLRVIRALAVLLRPPPPLPYACTAQSPLAGR